MPRIKTLFYFTVKDGKAEVYLPSAKALPRIQSFLDDPATEIAEGRWKFLGFQDGTNMIDIRKVSDHESIEMDSK